MEAPQRTIDLRAKAARELVAHAAWSAVAHP
jgi:hypothetical protein